MSPKEGDKQKWGMEFQHNLLVREIGGLESKWSRNTTHMTQTQYFTLGLPGQTLRGLTNTVKRQGHLDKGLQSIKLPDFLEVFLESSRIMEVLPERRRAPCRHTAGAGCLGQAYPCWGVKGDIACGTTHRELRLEGIRCSRQGLEGSWVWLVVPLLKGAMESPKSRGGSFLHSLFPGPGDVAKGETLKCVAV